MPESGGVSERVVSKVADREGLSVEKLPSLYDSIEPDALDELFNHINTKTGTELEVKFTYAGYIVVVRDPGDITLEE